MGLRAAWYDGRDQYYIKENTLKKIGIVISECSLCKEIHRLAKEDRERSSDFVIITHNKELTEHIGLVISHKGCPTVDMANCGAIDEL